MANEIWTVRRLLEWTEDFFRKKGVEGPRLEAQILLAHALGCPKIELYVRHDDVPAADKLAAFRDMIRQRAEGMPTAYLVGFREFYSLPFAVTPTVLIPRPETETLVMQALGVLKSMPAPRVLDLGTGSGCIAITIARQHKTAIVTAIDTSAAALEVAVGNATKHGVADRIAFQKGDLFGPVSGQVFDAIVSNPPYVADAEFAALDRSVRDYEPRAALDGGPDGLDFYRRLATSATAHLVPRGALLVEIGASQAQAVRDLIAARFTDVKLFTDPAGKPRVISARSP